MKDFVLTNEAKRWLTRLVDRYLDKKLIKASKDYEKAIETHKKQIDNLKERIRSVQPLINASVLRSAVLTELRCTYSGTPEIGRILLGCAYAFDLDDDWWNKQRDLPLSDWADVMLDLAILKELEYEKKGSDTMAKLALVRGGKDE